MATMKTIRIAASAQMSRRRDGRVDTALPTLSHLSRDAILLLD